MSALGRRADRTLTGWHVLGLFVGGFGIIIGVNVALAINAVRTFPGVETRNVYAASQTFDADRAAQDALGWAVALDHAAGRLTLTVRDARGAAVAPEVVEATLGRATTVADDRVPGFAWDGAALVAPVALAPGNWNLRVHLRAPDGTDFRRRIPLRVAR